MKKKLENEHGVYILEGDEGSYCGHYKAHNALCHCGDELIVAPTAFQAEHKPGDPVMVCTDHGVHSFRFKDLVPGKQPKQEPEPEPEPKPEQDTVKYDKDTKTEIEENTMKIIEYARPLITKEGIAARFVSHSPDIDPEYPYVVEIQQDCFRFNARGESKSNHIILNKPGTGRQLDRWV